MHHFEVCFQLSAGHSCQQSMYVHFSSKTLFVFPLFSLQTDDDNLTIYGHRLLKNRCLPTYSWGLHSSYCMCGWIWWWDVFFSFFYLGSNIYKEEEGWGYEASSPTPLKMIILQNNQILIWISHIGKNNQIL